MAVISQTNFPYAYAWMNMYVKIVITISKKFVHKGPINNIPTMVQRMAWRRPGRRPQRRLFIKWRIYASLCLNELRVTRDKIDKEHGITRRVTVETE